MGSKMKKPVNIIPSVNLTQPASTGTVTQGAISLSDDTKRHLAVGIALNNVLLPALKNLVDVELKKLYNHLVKHRSINTHQNNLLDPLQDGFGFEYREPKNDPKNYIIKTHHELAKLFLKPFMRHFKTITDDSFDASAALSIIERAGCGSGCSSKQSNIKPCLCFTPEQRELAKKIREQIRNPWAHCNISEWKATKYTDAFYLMEQMANALPANFDRVTLVQNLDTWKVNGLKLLGNNIDELLFKDMVEQSQKLMLKLDNLDQETKQKLQDVTTQLEDAMKKTEERQKRLKEDQLHINIVLLEHAQRITNLEDKDKTSSPLFSIPSQNPYFTGRENYLKEIDEVFSQEKNPIVTIQGLGGVGKTSLAVEAAIMAGKDRFPGGVYWLTADSSSGDRVLMDSISKVVKLLGKDTEEQSDNQKLETLTGHLIRQERCLLVIDNADAEKFSSQAYTLINGMWVSKSRVSMLVTSRLKEDTLTSNISRPSKNFNLQSFNLREGVEFLRKKTGIQEEELMNKGEELVSEVGGLPLALDQAAGFLNARRCKMSDYINRLKKEKLKLLNRKPATKVTEDVEEARLTVKTTWRMNMDLIQTEFPEAVNLMHILAFLSPNCIPISVINEGSPRLNDDLASMLDNDFDKREILYHMTKLSLFEEASDDSIRVHRLVQEILKDDITECGQKETVLRAAQSMLIFALGQEVNPSYILETDVMINWKEASLREWAIILENVGHFIEQLKKENVQTDKVGLCMLLDHTSLYYKILNQIDRSAEVRTEMIDMMSTFKGEERYDPKFPDTLQFKVKEVLCQLMDPKTVPETANIDDGEDRSAIESKDEGDFYLQTDRFQLAIEAYKSAINNNPPKNLRHDIQQNMCEAFHKIGNSTRCISQAHNILSDWPEDSIAYRWIALSHKKEAEREEDENGRSLRTELSSIYGALSWTFSGRNADTAEALKTENISFSNDIVTVVPSSLWLQKALEDSRSVLYKRSGVRNVIVLKPGVYQFHPSLWALMDNVCLIGEPTEDNQKPTILMETPTPSVHFKNTFINIHFKISAGQLTIGSQNGTCLFLDCTFVSNSPYLTEEDVAGVRERWEMLSKKEKELRDLSVEEWEQRRMAEEERKEEKEYHWKVARAQRMNAHPAIVVTRGVCVMVQCAMLDCLGAGALVLWPDNQTGIVTPPWLYMKGCTMRNCGFAGAEAREEGNLVLENCTISDCSQGILVWMDAHNVIVRKSSIYNSKAEGVIVTDPSMNYNNNMRVVFEQNYIHHNQIGLSLSHARSVDIRGNLIFSNKSWGIFLRNSNVSTIQSNNIFRNDCGGIRICLNRFDRTIVMKNHIHDHTGPGLCQTSFFSESQNQLLHVCKTRIARWYADGRISDERMEKLGLISPLDRDTNSVPVHEMDNIYDNNDLSYGSATEKKVAVEKDCGFCTRPKAGTPCNNCRKVWYCNTQCLKEHYEEHRALFCDFFTRTQIISLSLTPADISPANQLIANHIKEGKKKRLKDYKDREFLVKVTAGTEYFGLDEEMAKAKLQQDEEPEGSTLFVYDKLRFVCGVVENEGLNQFVRQYGKLCGEKIYSKRIYLFARICGKSENYLQIRTNEMEHEQGW